MNARPVTRALRNPPRPAVRGRYGWHLSNLDVLLLQHAAWEFARERHRVGLIPADPRHPMTRRGQMLRVKLSENPIWYQRLCARRPLSHSIRPYVREAFGRMLATKYIRPRAMDVELLTVLYDTYSPWDWGYTSWGGGLRLADHRWADRKRAVRAAREGRRPKRLELAS